MAKVFIEESSLTAIGDAIRNKTGNSALMSPAAMVTAINGITTGGDLPEGSLVLTGNCAHAFASPFWDWYIYLDGVTTNNITNAAYMFSDWDRNKDVKYVPFEINIADGCSCTGMFQYNDMTAAPVINGAIGDANIMFDQVRGLHSIPNLTFDNSEAHDYSSMFNEANHIEFSGTTFTNMRPTNMNRMFSFVTYTTELPEFVNLDTSDLKYCGSMFSNCHRLRSIPEEFLNKLFYPSLVGTSSTYSTQFSQTFYGCHVLDEVKGMNPQTSIQKSNQFSSTFYKCYRLKDITFAVQEDGTPYTVSWRNQTIDLSSNIGHAPTVDDVTDYYISEDKQVYDSTTYETLKLNPDWFTIDPAYSRYNYTSAVNTINSLPDTSAYLSLAENSGYTNTIRFLGAAGASTDGGAINTLTEEEIAVAVAKGWTVTFV